MARDVTVSHNPIHPLRLGLGLVACVGILVTLLTLFFGFKSVPANSVGVKTRFGAYHQIVSPGLAYAIPYVDRIHVLPTQRLLKLEFGFGSENATNYYQQDRQAEDTETMLTGDRNTGRLPWA